MQSAMQMFVARFASKDPRIWSLHRCEGLQLRSLLHVALRPRID